MNPANALNGRQLPAIHTGVQMGYTVYRCTPGSAKQSGQDEENGHQYQGRENAQIGLKEGVMGYGFVIASIFYQIWRWAWNFGLLKDRQASIHLDRRYSDEKAESGNDDGRIGRAAGDRGMRW